MKKKEYKVRLKRPLWFRFVKFVLRIFNRKPNIINLSGQEINPQAIYLSNHEGASGPLKFELYFPVTVTTWGTHEMCENFKTRWSYLYHVFYIQKLHWSKFKAFFVATVFAPVSILIYRAIGLIGTYTDARLKNSIKSSNKILDASSALLIFPEDSKEGYLPKPTAFNPGFVMMSKMYYKHAKVDVPVYQVYFSKKKRVIVIDKPIYINQLLSEGVKEQEIIDMQLKRCHFLYDNYIANNK